MQIKTLILGELETNCYLLIKDNDCIIIDPAVQSEKIIKEVGNLNVKAILITHNHFDHIGALEDLKRKYHLEENKYLDVDNLEVINTKGHTNDSKTFYFKDDKIMFCGDFLFKGTFGRTDLGGDNEDMIDSLNKIMQYDDIIKLYPGHGPVTTLKAEKINFTNYIDYLKKVDFY